jgi:hypothetical protein
MKYLVWSFEPEPLWWPVVQSVFDHSEFFVWALSDFQWVD